MSSFSYFWHKKDPQKGKIVNGNKICWLLTLKHIQPIFARISIFVPKKSEGGIFRPWNGKVGQTEISCWGEIAFQLNFEFEMIPGSWDLYGPFNVEHKALRLQKALTEFFRQFRHYAALHIALLVVNNYEKEKKILHEVQWS